MNMSQDPCLGDFTVVSPGGLGQELLVLGELLLVRE
jgi:hypothetical protein